ncbi:glycerophosphocholine permease Git4p [[Candida] railenensis]|uniref:Glycerophosphocholine permease Git4p n=1 Tax=[Candida] railenensis TaxID=45579 RepID=A0A9P0QL99_9ASCO|nr:glycerophosphocholine permease Git4p [[Candida] railenensis]
MSTRDLPKSIPDFFVGWTKKVSQELPKGKAEFEDEAAQLYDEDESAKKVTFNTLWPTFCCGAGLFSDGYVNNSIGTINTCLSTLYPKEYEGSNAISNVPSIAFVGIVVGQLTFGFVSDYMSRKTGMLAANVMLMVFSLLCSCATWGAHGSIYGMLAAITAFRFFLGVAIGSEYPTSSVIAAEFANSLPKGHRNRYFSWFTNAMIDLGFVISSFVPLVLLWIFTPRHLTAVWRLSFGLGVFPPLFLFLLRLKLIEEGSFSKAKISKTQKLPYWLIFKFYWFRLLVVALLWFMYDFSVYSFNTYSSWIFDQIIPGSDLYKSFGWNVVFNLFYMPGAIIGGWVSDYIGPRLTFCLGVGLQAIIGFAMGGCYPELKKHIAGFTVVFGIFSSLGELGPGNNIGILAARTSATPVRGQYYAIAAATGKIGAFVGTWVFPAIKKKYDKIDENLGMQVPIYISSALCFFSLFLCLFCCPSISQDALSQEDYAFFKYLKEEGYDISQFGDGSLAAKFDDVESETTIEETKTDKVNIEVEKLD